MKAYWFNSLDEVCGATENRPCVDDLKREIVQLLQNGSWCYFGEVGDKIEVVDDFG